MLFRSHWTRLEQERGLRLVVPMEAPIEWDRLLNGAPLRWPEVANGIAVQRRVRAVGRQEDLYGTAEISAWLAQPTVGILEPAERHWEVLQTLLSGSQVKGPLVMDAALAALAIEHGATLETTDRDFARFPGLKWRNPLDESH